MSWVPAAFRYLVQEGHRTLRAHGPSLLEGYGNFLATVASVLLRSKMSVQVEHQLDPSPKPRPTLIAVQPKQLALKDSKRPELGWKLVRDEHGRDQR